jgi:uroporphyrinogen decarboxylase
MTIAAENPRTDDGIHGLAPRERWDKGARLWRDTYDITPGAPLVKREFGYFCLERWYGEGLPRDANLAEEFHYDPDGRHFLGRLGWCEAAFMPQFEVKQIEDRGEYEVVQDFAGRYVLYFKGRRDGFMPTYLDHPVKDMRTWQENVRWRLAVDAPGRFDGIEKDMERAKEAAGKGRIMTQWVGGAYMYLRSLIGPEDLLFAFHDQPELIHSCMQAWLTLADAVVARHQEHVTLDEVFFGEDICYNNGSLISPGMMREFIFPYYSQLLNNVRWRQIDKRRKLHIQIDTDGYCVPLIPVYAEIGVDSMSPFEVASGCDVVEVGRKYPHLLISGGIDKRVLAGSKQDIDRMVERILPAMRERGGYIPTCDHGVPEEVSLENYRHYRKRCVELSG